MRRALLVADELKAATVWARVFALNMAAKDVLQLVTDSGDVFNQAEEPQRSEEERGRSRVLAGAAIELTQALLLFTAWSEGVDVVELQRTLAAIAPAQDFTVGPGGGRG